MIFTYTLAGKKRMHISEWYSMEKWPHNCPADRFHLHFIVTKGGRQYRCGPAPAMEAAQVSTLIYHAKRFMK